MALPTSCANMMARGGGLFKLIFGLVVAGGGWYTYTTEWIHLAVLATEPEGSL
jgi:hypothetical protein